MEILRETSSPGDVDALDRAWHEPATFAFLPEKSPVDEAWVARSLERLPTELRTGCFALLTSGTTGHPKLVVGSRERARALVRVLHEVQAGEPVREAILTLPLSYCYGFVNQWRWAREHDRRLVATRGFSRPDRLREALERAEAAMLCLVAAQLPLFERHLAGLAFPGVVRVHFAGGPFPQGELERLARRFPNARVYNNYGCAEAMPRLTVRPADAGRPASDVGAPLPGVELRAAAGDALEFRSRYGAVAFAEAGELRLLAPEAWVPTGDLAQPLADGSWELLGRADQVFKRYGEKVALATLLDTVGGAWSAAANFYRERDGSGEEGAVLVLSPAPSEAELRAILRGLRAGHPRTHWPLRIESVDELPRLPSGKTDTSALARLPGRRVHWRNRV